MTSYIFRRLLQAIIITILTTLVIFVAIRLLPGDPILMYISRQETESLTVEEIDLIRHKFGLDKPMAVQYFEWVSGLFHGDLGMSLFYREEVNKLIAQRLPVTLHLGLTAYVISTILGISAGTLSALRRGTTVDTILTMLANAGICVPIFWLGILLIYLFGLRLGWLPICGYTSPLDDFWLSTKGLIMPAICLMIFNLASLSRQTRSSTLEVIHQDYVRTAWSKGLKEQAVVIRHVLKNSLIPVITLMGMAFRLIIGGSVIIETVFNVPGMGRLAVSALLNQDYAIVQAIILLTAIMVVFANLLVDVCYGWLDPRIRYN